MEKKNKSRKATIPSKGKKESKVISKKTEKEVVSQKNVDVIKSRNSKIYFNYKFRIISFFVAFLCFFAASMYLLTLSLSYQNETYINYTEKSNLDYKVNLKENNYYDTKTLDKDMIYVASLIDSIDTYFNYNFNIDDNVDMKFMYSIVGKLRITDENGENTYLEKEYVLLDNKNIDMTDNNHVAINEKINIDYNKYNAIANGFKATYGVNPKSSFVVSLKVTKQSFDNSFKINNVASTQIINIPLSERAINIKLDYIDINSNSSVVSESDFLVSNVIYIILSIVLLIISIYFVLKSIRLFEKTKVKKNSFDKYVNKLLREYDRLIVESRTIIDFNNYEIIKVDRFEELLDVRDNLKLPINYYVVTPHQKAYFYIFSTNIYLYTVKEVDLEKK